MNPPRAVLAANLRALMQHRGWSARELSRQTRGDVTDRYIGMILKSEVSCSIEVLDKLARALKVGAWQLLVPGLPPNAEKLEAMSELVQRYNKASDDGRSWIEQVAERETKYNPDGAR